MAASNSAHTERPEKPPFPPLQKEHFPSQLFWLAICFIALYVIVSRLALPRIGSILEERRRRIEEDLSEAQRLKGDSDAAIMAYEKALADARGRAQALANEKRQKASAAGEIRRRDVDAKLNTRIADAEKSIAASRAAAMTNVRDIAGEAAGAIVERLIGVAPRGREVAKAVDAVLKR